MSTLIERLNDEADLCRSEGANDIAMLLDEASSRLVDLQKKVDFYVSVFNDKVAELSAANHEIFLLAAAQHRLHSDAGHSPAEAGASSADNHTAPGASSNPAPRR